MYFIVRDIHQILLSFVSLSYIPNCSRWNHHFSRWNHHFFQVESPFFITCSPLKTYRRPWRKLKRCSLRSRGKKKHAFAGANDESSSINFGYLTGIAYEKKTLLRVIPTMTFIYTFSYWQIFWHSIWHIFWHSIWHIFWHMFWHIFWHIFWHSIWQIFWHSIWHIFWHSIWHIFWHSIWHIFWHSIWHIFWHSIWPPIWHIFWHSIWPLRPGSAHWDLELAVEVRQCPLGSGARGWGPAVPTATWKSRFEVRQCPLRSATRVEVRQCPLGSGARGGGPAVPTGIWTARRVRRRRRRRALLKSSNPHLAGGEKQYWFDGSHFLMIWSNIYFPYVLWVGWINNPRCSMYGIFTYIYPKNSPYMEHLGIWVFWNTWNCQLRPKHAKSDHGCHMGWRMMKRPLSAGWKDQVLIASKNTRFDPARNLED